VAAVDVEDDDEADLNGEGAEGAEEDDDEADDDEADDAERGKEAR
jgi:hypothetical protein